MWCGGSHCTLVGMPRHTIVSTHRFLARATRCCVCLFFLRVFVSSRDHYYLCGFGLVDYITGLHGTIDICASAQ